MPTRLDQNGEQGRRNQDIAIGVPVVVSAVETLRGLVHFTQKRHSGEVRSTL